MAHSLALIRMSKICITLATYNGEKYLAEMLDSLVLQTRQADLIIAVDDGSKDATPQILESFKDKLPLQIIRFEKNQGHRAAFSKALETARAQLNDDDLIFLADQDDVWRPHKLEIMAQKIMDKSMIFGDAEIINGNGKMTSASWREKNGIVENLSQKALLTGYTNVTGCMVMFRASLLHLALPIPEDVPVHDQWITLCATIANGYAAISDKVIRYRIHNENAIGEGNKPWSEKLSTNLHWANAVRNSRIYPLLPESSRKFLDDYIAFSTARFKQKFVPKWFSWICKNRKELYPQCSENWSLMIPRVLFSIVGVSTAKKYFKKK